MVYQPGTPGYPFAGVGVRLFQNRRHTAFYRRPDVLVDTVADKQYVFQRLAEPFSGNSKDANVGLAKIKLVRLKPDTKKVQYA